MHRKSVTVLALAALLLLLPQFVLAQSGRTEFRHDILVSRTERAAAVTCFFCSATIFGEATGKLAVLRGDAIVYGAVDGDAVVAGGNLVVKDGGTMRGDVTLVRGRLIREGSGRVLGKVSEGSAGKLGRIVLWSILLLVVLPLFLLVLLIFLNVVVARRNRRYRESKRGR